MFIIILAIALGYAGYPSPAPQPIINNQLANNNQEPQLF